MDFCKAFNAQTQRGLRHDHPRRDHGLRGSLVHLHHEDPARRGLIKEKAGIAKGSGEPHTNKVGKITAAQVREIAEIKMPT